VATGSVLSSANPLLASPFRNDHLQVWSCGGLADAFLPAKAYYEQWRECHIDYTGAYAGALGKSLLGSATTEVFAPRSLELAHKLRAQGKMLHFVPLCFTKYVLVTPKGNPGNIHGIQDLARPGVKTVLSPQASPPGGEASTLILKEAGVLEAATKNAVVSGDCVQRVFPKVTPGGKGDVAVMELRLTRKAGFEGKTETIEIPEEFIPAKPVPFVIGLMKWAHNREMAEDFIRFATSEKGQSFFAAAGFIPAKSGEGERLIQKYGIHDA
jgi:molybdate transport system substrate-binding protein